MKTRDRILDAALRLFNQSGTAAISTNHIAEALGMSQILKPPAPLPDPFAGPSVFLAGSIAMGRAAPWQAEVERALEGMPITILNPRRDDWDATWPQRADHPQFREQVEWELAAQERADLIAMYIAPDTQAPISLLELGLFARSGRLVVCCPEGFWRKGNVDIVCARYGVPQVADLGALVDAMTLWHGAHILRYTVNTPP